MAFEPQRHRDKLFALSSRKQTAFGTAISDALLTYGARIAEVALPEELKEFRSDLDFIKGNEFAADLQVRRQDWRWGPSFDLNSFLAAYVSAFCLGKVSTVTTDTTAFTHTITPTAPPTDSVVLPVTTVSVKKTADISKKFVDGVVKGFTLSGANNAGDIRLALEMIGSGLTAAGMASYPAVATPDLGPLFNSDMKIFIGTEGSPVEISERIVEWAVQISNNFDEGLGYFPGSGLYRGRAFHGDRRSNVTLGVMAKDVDDIKTLFDGSTTKEIKFLCELASPLAGSVSAKHTLQMRFPATRITKLEEGDASGFHLWRIIIGPEGIFKGSTLVQPFEFQVINKQATYLATS